MTLLSIVRRWFLFVVTFCLVSTSVQRSASATDLHTLTTDLACQAVMLYHPKVKYDEIRVVDYAFGRYGDVAKTYAVVEFSKKNLNRARTAHLAEVRVTLVDVPNRQVITNLDYLDNDRTCLANVDYTPGLIAEYNITLERANHLPGLDVRSPLLGSQNANGFHRVGSGRRMMDKSFPREDSGSKFMRSPVSWFRGTPAQSSPCFSENPSKSVNQ
ncbi:hypothetical protein AB1L42_01600 [Thalassoglobus sp. JC818]|uniref:hypothetical protein n=1 Tax=Thalassoglobus sp. JC818 TaxID=3232136 RepID=UPI003458CAA2